MNAKKITWEITKVERESFLRSTLQPYVSANVLESLVESDNVSSQIDEQIQHRAAKDCIRKRCMCVAGLSGVTSMSGALGTMVLLPVDFAQFAYHAAKLSQELYYLYAPKELFTIQKKDDLDVLIYMLAGAGGAITLSTSSFSAIGQKLYQKACQKVSFKALSMLPFVGCAIHGSMSAYALYSLAEEYREKLCEMNEQEEQTTPQEFAKGIGTYIDVEYHEAEEKLRQFCNLSKLRELYAYLENGYINEQEFEQMKLDV